MKSDSVPSAEGQPPRADSGSLIQGLFVREDLTKPENRANVLLVAASSIDPFWDRLHILLRLSPDAVLRPEKNHLGGRPDIIASLDGRREAIIECENWGENLDQSKAYGAEGVRLVLILRSQPNNDVQSHPKKDAVTWATLREIALQAAKDACERQRTVLGMLVGAIDDILGLAPVARPHLIDPAAIAEGWLRDAAKPLLEAPPGLIRTHGVAVGSASIRLLAPRAAFRKAKRTGVFLAMAQHTRPDKVFLAGPRHLNKHLADTLQDWIAGPWSQVLASLTDGYIGENRSGMVAVAAKNKADGAVGVAAALEVLLSRLQTLD